tara:strand:- start:1193 stop:1735 length:543 start_codon:yes stop_codon:yes gene_type:complete
MSSGVATRYAKAIFGLAKEDKQLNLLERDLSSLSDALKISEDLRNLISSPIYSRSQQELAIIAISKKMNLTDLMQNTLGLMSSKRRLYILPSLIDEVNSYIAEDKGEVTVSVTSADELSEVQSKKLVKTLKNAIGKEIKIKSTIDQTLIGGLIVKVGSKMIDSSIRSKLENLQNIMKEVR